jgi:lipopolysaccharide export system ATP-binding protein
VRLQATGLSKTLGGRAVVQGVDFCVEPGNILGLLGPNGAGKTTTFRMVAGLLEPDQGRVELGGRPLRGSLAQRVRAGLGYLPQRPAMFSGLSVRQQLLVPLEVRGVAASEADRLLEQAGLRELAGASAERLSGGERRRLELARCLATDPRVVLLDEPFAGVDPVSVGQLCEQLRELAARGLALLITDHAAREALSICDRVVLLDQGSVLAEGSPAEIQEDPRVRERWLGHDWPAVELP